MRFTIAIPCLNAATTLPDTLQSLRPQLSGDVEVLLADGGSTDGSREIAEATGFVRVLSGGDDSLYAGFNRGAVAAQGDYVLFLNADDRLGAGAIDACRKALATRPGVPLISGGARVEGDLQHEASPLAPLDPAGVLFGLPAVNARFFSRSLFERRLFEPERGLAADRLFLFGLAVDGVSGIAIEHLVYRYRSHPGSRTIGDTPEARRRAVEADLKLATALLRDPRYDGRQFQALLRSWATLQRLRAARWGIAGPKMLDLAHLPMALTLWRRHRGVMAGW